MPDEVLFVSGCFASSISEQLSKELLQFILLNTSVKYFNDCVRNFQTKELWKVHKIKLKYKLKALVSEKINDVGVSIIMSDIFKPFAVDEELCYQYRQEIGRLKYQISLYNKYRPEKSLLIKAHNALVLSYAELIAPQNKLISEFKKVVKCRSKITKFEIMNKKLSKEIQTYRGQGFEKRQPGTEAKNNEHQAGTEDEQNY